MKTGYKATYNMKCNSLTYEVGKEYSISSMEMCNHGFHFCDNLDDCLDYYDFKPETKFIKIEILGQVETSGNKSVTDRIKVLEVIEKPEFKRYKFDSKGNIIYRKTPSGNEYKYGSKGNIIYTKYPNGNEYHYKYDSNGNMIYMKDSSGRECHWEYKYDSKGNMIYRKNSNGDEWTITIK